MKNKGTFNQFVPPKYFALMFNGDFSTFHCSLLQFNIYFSSPIKLDPTVTDLSPASAEIIKRFFSLSSSLLLEGAHISLFSLSLFFDQPVHSVTRELIHFCSSL